MVAVDEIRLVEELRERTQASLRQIGFTANDVRQRFRIAWRARHRQRAVHPAQGGPDVLGGQHPQVRIAPGEWQAADADRGWTLVYCIVSPAFEFAGFTLAEAGWEPGSRI